VKLRVSDDLSLGEDFVVSTAGIFATKGMGKSFLAQVMAEELLAQGHVVVAIDPTDSWWGLRSSADGKHDGHSIVVIGGDHGDLKLEPDAGTKLAEAIVAERFSCVLCTDGLSDTAEIRFVREFLDALYRRNREPLHVFIDEADIFAPQKPFEVEDSRCIRAMSHVVRRGRKKGVGSTLITQRPAELNMSVRSQVEMLFVLGMSHNLDIEAVEKWLRLRKKKGGDNAAYDLQEQMIGSLDSLPQGDAWVWAPRLKIHQRFRARAKRTFDSGATPRPGKQLRTAKRLAPVDIARLGAAIAEAVQRQKENDPRELRKQVADLRRALEHVGKGQDRSEANEKANHAENLELRAKLAALTEDPPSALKKADLDRLEKIVARAEVALNKHDAAVSRHYQGYAAALESYTRTSKAVTSAAIVAIDDLRARIKTAPPPPPAGAAPPRRRPDAALPDASATSGTPPRASRAAKTNGAHVARVTDPDLQPAHLRILSAIAWWESVGVSAPDFSGVAFVAKTSTKSSAFENNRSRLRTAGYIEYPSSGRVQLTAAGRAIAPPPDVPPTNAALQEAVFQKIKPAVGRLLRVLIEEYPREIEMGAWAARAGTSTTSSAFENNRSWLRARGLAEYPRAGFARATQLLFPESSP
jgi:uncharacterized protein